MHAVCDTCPWCMYLSPHCLMYSQINVWGACVEPTLTDFISTCHNKFKTEIEATSRVAASASTSIRPWRPLTGGRYRRHSVMMWFAVCWSAPQSQAGLLDKPHLHISALKRPTPVRSLLSLTLACRGRSDPWQLLERWYIHAACW